MTAHDDGPDEADRALLAELGARTRLWAAGSPARAVSRGGENATFEVAGHVVRRASDPAAAEREVALLRALADATPVPTPVPVAHDPERGVVAYRRLPGTSLLHRRARATPDVEDALGDVLSALRRLRLDVELPEDPEPTEDAHRAALRTFDAVRAHLRPDRAALVAAVLDSEPPPTSDDLVRQHNDLGAEHVLVDAHGRVTGVIDWTDAALADRARDTGRMLRDLGPALALRVAERLDGPPSAADVRRILLHARCTWLEDVEYGLQDPAGRAVYLENADRTFGQVFGGPARGPGGRRSRDPLR